MGKKIFLVVGIVVGVVILFLIGGEVVKRQTGSRGQTQSTDSTTTEQMPTITANFVNLDQIAAITKFRSCQGHIVVPQDGSETRSNMKHYFYLKKEFTKEQGQVPLYAPFDGYVTDIFDGDGEFSDRNPASRDVSLGTKKGFTARSAWAMTILHIIPVETLKEGDAIKAGELLGHVSLELIPPYFAFDVTYAKMGTMPKQIDNWRSPYKALESVFDHMDKNVLAQYDARFGVGAAQDFSVAKATRDASPCQYGEDGRQFSRQLNKDWNNDWLGNLEDAVGTTSTNSENTKK